MAKVRDYALTWNNYTDADIDFLKSLDTTYLLLGREIAPTTGTRHLHVYLRFPNARSFKSVKKELGNQMRIEFVKKEEAWMRYCKKEFEYEEFGERPQQGKRTDIDRVRNQMEDRANMRTIVRTATSIQSIRYAEIHLKYFEEPRDWKPEVFWYYGKTGSGKTRRAYEESNPEDRYVSMSNGKWFEGYDGHSDVIFDDLRPTTFKFEELLRLLDRYEFRIECKGGSRQFRARRIWITTPYAPDDEHWSPYETDKIEQLVRRCDKIINFNEPVFLNGEQQLIRPSPTGDTRPRGDELT